VEVENRSRSIRDCTAGEEREEVGGAVQCSYYVHRGVRRIDTILDRQLDRWHELLKYGASTLRDSGNKKTESDC
jgi:hypothetical protein